MGDQAVGVQTVSAETLRTVSDIWTRALGPKGRGENASLLHIGVGTKRILRLLDEIESAFGVKLPIGVALKLGTVEALADAIKARRWPGPSPLVLLKDGSDDHPPLYLIAGAWGIILETCNLALAIDHPGKTWGLQPPGFDGDEASLDSIQALASHYVEHTSRMNDHPVNVIGFSFGGLIALEMGRLLHDQNRRTGLIGLIDTPLAERRWPFAKRARYLWARSTARLRGLINVHGERRADAIRNILRPLRNRILGAVFNRPVFASAYQPTLDVRLKAVLDRIIVANEKYIPTAIDVPIVLFKAKPDSSDLVDAEEIWRPYIRALDVIEVEGRHGNMIRPPLVKGLAAAVAGRLNEPAERTVRSASV
ncbi:thioesterase domain-containing protein [Bradyrhizobium sp. BR13661]|jgi:thioesterase domain-containing protein|uniref:thioesterase domain-containing protein n=1 Tax=Bradyrhizobium sp. BR13661 TaxID=2940622 RepID=UPI0024748903|nr:thioesterase domain-containing protein [Bradyrhizobium sp. BR13661]MDH6258158.1 thioesterase domain-containing protein [Bradyrhizobium sp. BR13661]